MRKISAQNLFGTPRETLTISTKFKVNHEYVLAYFKDAFYSESAIGKVIDPNTPEESNLRKGYADNNINKNNPENTASIVELPAGFPCSEESLFYAAKDVDETFFKKTKEEKYISDTIKEKYQIENKSGLPVKLDDMVVEDYKLAKPCRIYVGMANKNKLLEFMKNDCNEVLDDGLPIKFYINSNAAIRYRKKNENPRNVKDKKRLQILTNLIDLGEASTIALSLEIEDSIAILDDLKAQKVAMNLNLKFTGLLGVILKAKQEGIINSVHDVLHRLKSARFRISKAMETEVLRLANE